MPREKCACQKPQSRAFKFRDSRRLYSGDKNHGVPSGKEVLARSDACFPRYLFNARHLFEVGFVFVILRLARSSSQSRNFSSPKTLTSSAISGRARKFVSLAENVLTHRGEASGWDGESPFVCTSLVHPIQPANESSFRCSHPCFATILPRAAPLPV